MDEQEFRRQFYCDDIKILNLEEEVAEVEEKEEKRQVPKPRSAADPGFFADKDYYDLLYGYCQTVMFRQNGHNLVKRKDVSIKRISEVLQLSWNTAKSKFNRLLELGLLVPYNNDYELIVLSEEQGYLINAELLEKLVYCFRERTLTIYTYLANRYYAANFKPFVFYIDTLKQLTGVSTGTRNNNKLITIPLQVLQDDLHIIEFEVEKRQESGQFCSVYILKSLKYRQ